MAISTADRPGKYSPGSRPNRSGAGMRLRSAGRPHRECLKARDRVAHRDFARNMRPGHVMYEATQPEDPTGILAAVARASSRSPGILLQAAEAPNPMRATGTALCMWPCHIPDEHGPSHGRFRLA